MTAITHSRPGVSDAHVGTSSQDFGGRPELTAAFWDEARGDLTPERRIANLTLILALAALSWAAPVAFISWLVG